MSPQLSVVMPVFNVERHLRQSLDSICAQTFSNFELIAINDGSLDASQSILLNYAHLDHRIRLVHWPKNRGIVAALNHGIDLAQADLIARMDGDDLSHPQRLEQQVDYLERHPEIGVLGTLVDFLHGELDGRGFDQFVTWANSVVTEREIEDHRFVETPLVHPTVMFRKSLVKQYGGYRDGEFPEDYELWLRWLQAGVRMVKLPSRLLSWRDRADRLTRTDSRYKESHFYKTKSTYLANWLKDRGIRRVMVWGAGRVTRKRASHLLHEGIEITHFIDIDKKKIGQTLQDRLVIDWRELPRPGHAFVLSYVAAKGARVQITSCLERMGYELGRDYLLAA